MFHAWALNLNFVSFSDHASKCLVHYAKIERERERGCILLEPDILKLKCYIISKVKFQNNLETVDIPLFGDTGFAANLITLCLLIVQKDVSASWRMLSWFIVLGVWLFYFSSRKPDLPNNVLSMTQLKTKDLPDQVKALLINGELYTLAFSSKITCTLQHLPFMGLILCQSLLCTTLILVGLGLVDAGIFLAPLCQFSWVHVK